MAQEHTYQGDEPVRLNKWMAQLGLCSRREAEALISRGEVKVNGETVTEPGHKISPGETMILGSAGAKALDDQLTAVLHKPVGYVSAQPEAGQTPAVRWSPRPIWSARRRSCLARRPSSPRSDGSTWIRAACCCSHRMACWPRQ